MVSIRTHERTSSQPSLFVRLNTTWHEPALWVYAAIVLLHWLEHLAQAYQIWMLDLPRPESLGAVGAVLPWLVESETMHFGFALFMLGGLIILAPAFSGAAAKWWYASLAIQTWHFVEHALLQGQVGVGSNLFHSDVPMSVFQQWIPRAELHLLYNLLVFIPMVVAMVLHTRPPKGATPDACSCAKEPVLSPGDRS
jgi:hypothetical protein